MARYRLKKKWPRAHGWEVLAKFEGDLVKFLLLGKTVKCTRDYFFERYEAIPREVN